MGAARTRPSRHGGADHGGSASRLAWMGRRHAAGQAGAGWVGIACFARRRRAALDFSRLGATGGSCARFFSRARRDQSELGLADRTAANPRSRPDVGLARARLAAHLGARAVLGRSAVAAGRPGCRAGRRRMGSTPGPRAVLESTRRGRGRTVRSLVEPTRRRSGPGPTLGRLGCTRRHARGRGRTARGAP